MKNPISKFKLVIFSALILGSQAHQAHAFSNQDSVVAIKATLSPLGDGKGWLVSDALMFASSPEIDSEYAEKFTNKGFQAVAKDSALEEQMQWKNIETCNEVLLVLYAEPGNFIQSKAPIEIHTSPRIDSAICFDPEE